MPTSLRLLSCFYILLLIIAVWRFVDTNSLEVFTLGVLPVLYGIWKVKPWTLIALRAYLVCQTLAFSALAVTAIIAYVLTPQDVKVVFKGQNIPMFPLILGICGLLAFQWWAAFNNKNISFFKNL